MAVELPSMSGYFEHCWPLRQQSDHLQSAVANIQADSLHHPPDQCLSTGIHESERTRNTLLLKYAKTEIDIQQGKISWISSPMKTFNIRQNYNSTRAYNESNSNITSTSLLFILFINHAATYLISPRQITTDKYKMIALKSLKILRITSFLQHNYIKKKTLDEIEANHGKSALQRAIMYSKQATHIAKEGFFGFKKDLKDYFDLMMLERVQNQPLTPQQKELKKKVKQELNRLKPIVIIQILPFSAPLLIFYLLTYPTKVPSYFCLDELFELHQKQAIQAQKRAIDHYKVHPINRTTFSVAQSTLEELKQLSHLLFGDYEDGVVGINKYFKKDPKKYLIHTQFSRHIAISNIKKQLKNLVYDHPELQEQTIEQQILWKYDRVMNGEDLLVFIPVSHDVAQKIEEEESTTKPNTPQPQPKKQPTPFEATKNSTHKAPPHLSSPSDRHHSSSPTRKPK